MDPNIPAINTLPTGFYSVASRGSMEGLPENIAEGHACMIIRTRYYSGFCTLVLDVDDAAPNPMYGRRGDSHPWMKIG